ncbi:cellulase [Streptomyces indiaensis]|uniref:Cellulase n=1 Tax=Streptomyces indiaensis TaxID=284033 RepID=A0ABN3E239_9ACTN|nr:cellulase [Streptomyces indiaensis]MCF1645644.1 cellulase [Streptomyces indiaensis]
MDDFERDLSRLMHDTREHTPYEPAHRQRLHAGIRARRRSRMLWKAGGSAVAVAGLSVGLAFLPGMLTRAQPADPRPQPATSPTSSPDGTPTTEPSATSPTPTLQPETSLPATTTSVTPSGTTTRPADPTPTATASESRTGTTPPAPPPSPTPTTVPPSVLDSGEPSASASTE